MKNAEEVKLMIARLEGRLEVLDACGYTDEDRMKLEALKWVMGEVVKL